MSEAAEKALFESVDWSKEPEYEKNPPRPKDMNHGTYGPLFGKIAANWATTKAKPTRKSKISLSSSGKGNLVFSAIPGQRNGVATFYAMGILKIFSLKAEVKDFLLSNFDSLSFKSPIAGDFVTGKALPQAEKASLLAEIEAL